jgi:hypothetical protein
VKSYYVDDLDDDGDWIETRYDVHDCPFCGSKNTDLYQTQVKCERCGAQGPDVDDDIWPLAITLWNELPRKQGDELEQLRLHWSNMMRRVRRAEKKARLAREKRLREVNAPIEKRNREYAQWAREREAWLRSPIEGSDA